jgi:hypothetical protein
MQAYRIHKMVIAADIAEEACDFYRNEIGGTLPDVIEEMPYLMEVCCDDGTVKTIKARINEELDARNAWLRMGIPCDLHRPFVIGTLP